MNDLSTGTDLPPDWIETFFDVLEPEWLANQFRRLERFRRQYSPMSRWWHRPPTMSPIVPLFYWSMLDLHIDDDQPMGVWRGDPSQILGRLLAAIMEFISFWNALPNERGRGQLRHALRNPGRFFGFLHEVQLATHIKHSGYEVEPLFFDPASERGEPDLIVHEGGRSFDVQCKSLNPASARAMPYDIFQFFAGAYSRLVQDSGRSYFLYVNLKDRVDEKSARRILNDVRDLTRSGLTTEGTLEKPAWAMRLVELGWGPGSASPDEAQRLMRSTPGVPLYFEMERFGQELGLSSQGGVAACYISGEERRPLERFVFDAAGKAVKAHAGDRPLIISVAVYQETDMSEYMNGPEVGPIYYRWSKRFFDEHRDVPLLLMSSNYSRYWQVGDDMALGTKYLAVESQYWDNVLPKLGSFGS